MFGMSEAERKRREYAKKIGLSSSRSTSSSNSEDDFLSCVMLGSLFSSDTSSYDSCSTSSDDSCSCD